MLATPGVPVLVIVVVTVRFTTVSVTVTSVLHGLPHVLVTVVVTVAIETGTRLEHAAEIVLAAHVDRAVGVGLWPGRLAGFARASPVANASVLTAECFAEGVCTPRLTTVVLRPIIQYASLYWIRGDLHSDEDGRAVSCTRWLRQVGFGEFTMIEFR